MSKERKVQHGTSNVSARSGQSSSRTPPFPVTTGPTKFYRSWTHKLVSPDVYNPPQGNRENDRAIRQTATWKQADVYNRNFSTTHGDSYRVPTTLKPPPEPIPFSSAEMEAARKKSDEQHEALEQMTKMAKAHFGTTAGMLKFFNKKHEDDLSMEELGVYLKRNNVEKFLTQEDRNCIFELVDPQHDGKVPVVGLLRKAEEQEFHDAEHAEDMKKIRAFLLDHIEKRRKEKSETEKERRHRHHHHRHHRHHPEVIERKKLKGIHEEGKKLKAALGQKTFDLDIGHDELHEAIEHLSMYQLPDTEEHRKFVRFLRHSNLNLSTIQFYDMRLEELENLKHRAVLIDQQLEDPNMVTHLEELAKTRWNGSLATANHDYVPPSLQEQLSTSPVAMAKKAAAAAEAAAAEAAAAKDMPALKPSAEPSTSPEQDFAGSMSMSYSYSIDGSSSYSSRPPGSPTAAAAAASVLYPETTSNAASRDGNRVKSGGRDGGKVVKMETSKSMPSLSLSARPSPLASARIPPITSPTSALLPVSPSPDGIAAAAGGGERTPGAGSSRERLSPLPGASQSEQQVTRAAAAVGAKVIGAKSSNAGGAGAAAEKKTRNFLNDSKGMAYEELAAAKSDLTTDQIGSELVGPITHEPQAAGAGLKAKLKKEIFNMDMQGQSSESDFYAQLIEEGSTMRRAKDPTKVMRIEKIDQEAYMPTGKRLLQSGTADLTRNGLGGGYEKLDNNDQFLTTNSKLYPPLIYEASKPVARDLISDAELAYMKKKMFREQRYARTQANLAVTKVRIEHDALESEIRSLRRAQGRLDNRIRYQTNVFLNDLKSYKQQPLVRMARKQNIKLAERMWRGNADPQTVVLVPEKRDFATTYTASYLTDKSTTTATGD